MKYYSGLANKPNAGIDFEPYDRVGGMLYGIYATSDKDQIKSLGDLAKDKSSRVEEIRKDQYDNFKKKALTQSKPFVPRNVPSPTPTKWAMQDRVARVVENPNQADQPSPEREAIPKSVEEILITKPVNTKKKAS